METEQATAEPETTAPEEITVEPETTAPKENNDPKKQEYRIGVFHGRAFFYVSKKGIHEGERDIPLDTRLELSNVPEFLQKSFGIREGEVATLVKDTYNGRLFEFGTGEAKPRSYSIAGFASKTLIIRYAKLQGIPGRPHITASVAGRVARREARAAMRRQAMQREQEQRLKRLSD